MTRKVDLRHFFMSETSEKKYANSLFESQFSVQNVIFYANVRENERFIARVFLQHVDNVFVSYFQASS